MAQGAGYLALLRAGACRFSGERGVAAHKGEVRAYRSRRRRRTRFEADVLALGYGFVPSTELARQLGCRHRYVDRHVGYLATEAEADGRTSVEAVFAVGDGANLGGAVVARERAMLAADAMLRDLKGSGLAPPVVAGATGALRRAEAFQDALWTLFPAPPPIGAVRDDGSSAAAKG